MRYAILSDIHANLEALKAVVEACQQQGVERFLCGGDTVGYGVNPQECLNFLHKFKVISVAGNHDWAVGGRLDAKYFNKYGKAGIVWSRANIPFEYFNYLNSLKTVYKNDDLILTHASLKVPEQFDYLNDLSKAPDTFYLMDRPICFIGHTHKPQILVQQGGNIMYAPTAEIEINTENKYIVNVGSVGQPRDGNPLASYCLYDTDLEMVELKRVRYNVAETQRKILEAGLLEFIATRLVTGD